MQQLLLNHHKYSRHSGKHIQSFYSCSSAKNPSILLIQSPKGVSGTHSLNEIEISRKDFALVEENT